MNNDYIFSVSIKGNKHRVKGNVVAVNKAVAKRIITKRLNPIKIHMLKRVIIKLK